MFSTQITFVFEMKIRTSSLLHAEKLALFRLTKTIHVCPRFYHLIIISSSSTSVSCSSSNGSSGIHTGPTPGCVALMRI